MLRNQHKSVNFVDGKMAKKQYISSERGVTRLARNKRMRQGGVSGASSAGGGVNTSVTITGGELDESIASTLHTHDNLDTLDQLEMNDGYLWFGDVKANAGHADTAGVASVAEVARELDRGAAIYREKLSKVDADEAAGVITFGAGALTRGDVGSVQCVRGWNGSGWTISAAGSAEVNDLVVRRSMKVFELLIQQVRSTGGEIVVSAANGRVSAVSGNVVTIESGSDTADAFGNMFAVGDIVVCRRWDNTMSVTHEWSAIVGNVSGNAIRLDSLEGDQPKVGDQVVQMGSVDDTERQGVVTISASEGGEPRITIMGGVDSLDTGGKVRAVLGGLSGVRDAMFGNLTGYGLYSDNAYLRGEFRLQNGEEVGASLQVLQDQVSSVVRGMSADGNLVVNGMMEWFDGWAWTDVDRRNGTVQREDEHVIISGDALAVHEAARYTYPRSHYDNVNGRPCLHVYTGTDITGELTLPTGVSELTGMKLSVWLKTGDDFDITIGGVTYECIIRGTSVAESDNNGWERHEFTLDLAWGDTSARPTLTMHAYDEALVADVRLYQPVSSEIKQTADEIELSVGNELQSTGIDITQHQITLKGDTLVQTGDYSGSLFTSRIIDGVEKSVFASDLVITEQVIATWPTGEKRITINYNASGALQYWYPIGEGETTQRLMRSEEISYDTNGSINGFKVVFYNRDGSVRWVQNANGTISGTGSTPPAPVINWVAHWYVDCGQHDEPIEQWDVQSALQPNLTLWSKNGGSGKMYYDTSLSEDSTATENDESGKEFDGWVCDPQMEWVATPELGDGTGYYRRWVAQYVDGVLKQEEYKRITTKD